MELPISLTRLMMAYFISSPLYNRGEGARRHVTKHIRTCLWIVCRAPYGTVLQTRLVAFKCTTCGCMLDTPDWGRATFWDTIFVRTPPNQILEAGRGSKSVSGEQKFQKLRCRKGLMSTSDWLGGNMTLHKTGRELSGHFEWGMQSRCLAISEEESENHMPAPITPQLKFPLKPKRYYSRGSNRCSKGYAHALNCKQEVQLQSPCHVKIF